MSRIPRPLAVLLAAAMLALAVPAQATAATPLERRVAQLAKQVKTLQTQVRTLRNQVRTLGGGLYYGFGSQTCSMAIVADTFQGTWTAIDQRMQALGQQPIFGSQAPVNDFGNCGLLERPTVARPGIVSPPTIAAFNPLLSWLRVDP